MLNIGSKLALEIFLINLEKKETALANPSMLPLPVDFKALIPGRWRLPLKPGDSPLKNGLRTLPHSPFPDLPFLARLAAY